MEADQFCDVVQEALIALIPDPAELTTATFGEDGIEGEGLVVRTKGGTFHLRVTKETVTL